MSSLKAASVSLVMMVALTGVASAADLGLKFTEGEESAYTVTMKLQAENSATAAGASQTSKTDTGLSVTMRTKVESSEGPAVLGVTFAEPKLDQTILGPAGEIGVAVDGEKVTMKKDGRTIVDSSAGTGTDLAGAIRSELGFFGSAGRVSLDSRGRIADVQGDAAIREVLADSTGPGLFSYVAPAGEVEVGESWSVVTRISKLRGLDLSATPLQVTTEYTLRSLEDGVATIGVASRLSERDVSATAHLLGNTEQFVNITSIQRTASGTIKLDVASGSVLSSDIGVEFNAALELRVDGENVRQVSKGTASVGMTLDR